MGNFFDFLFGKDKKPAELSSTYKDITGLDAYKPQFGYTTQVENLLGSIDKISPGGVVGTQYLKGLLQSPGQNVLESQAFQQYQQALENRFGDILSRNLSNVAAKAGASGLLRGSGAERMTQKTTQDVMNQLNAMLGQQAFQAEQAGLNRAFKAASLLPEIGLNQAKLELAKAQADTQGYMGLGQLLANMGQQGYQNELSKLGLQANVAQAIPQLTTHQPGLFDIAQKAITNFTGSASTMMEGGQNPSVRNEQGGLDLTKIALMAMGIPPVF